MTKLRRANSRKTTRLDLHVHTRGSDGWGSAEEIVARAIERGLDGLVICDHHHTTTKGGTEVIELGQKHGLIMLHGCEYATKQGHCLVYGVDVDTLQLGRYPEMQTVIDAARASGGVAFPSHPFYGYHELLGHGIYRLQGLVAAEALNGQNEVRAPQTNLQAEAAIRDLGIRAVGGSDAHNPEQVGLTFTEFRGRITTEHELVRALLHGDYLPRRNRRALEAMRIIRTRVFPEFSRSTPKFYGLDNSKQIRDLGFNEVEKTEARRQTASWTR
jgi:hypothetical protein